MAKEFLQKTPTSFYEITAGDFCCQVNSITPENVRKLLSILETLMDKTGHSPSKIFNADETGITIVQGEH